jgi:hypothetical protein
MSGRQRFADRAIPEAYGDLVWESGTNDEREVMDCRVVRIAGSYVLKVSCDTPDGPTQHVLKSPEAVARFLDPVERFDTTGWTDVESWIDLSNLLAPALLLTD